MIEDLLKKLLGLSGNADPTAGGTIGNPTASIGEIGYINPGPQNVSQSGRPSMGMGVNKKERMSQESMDAYKELRYDLEAAAKRNMPREIRKGENYAEVKMPQPGLAVEDYAPVADLGLVDSITGGSKEQRSWKARDEDELWKALRRGLV